MSWLSRHAAGRRLLRAASLLVILPLVANAFVAIGWLRPVVVVGDSMEPTLAPGQSVLVRRWRTPQRWDVVVVRNPLDPQQLLVKRVIGLPGETLTLAGGDVWADGRRLDPGNQSAAGRVYYGAFGSPTWRLGADEWFVTGDHQVASIDSRNWAAPAGVPARLLVGTVVGGR